MALIITSIILSLVTVLGILVAILAVNEEGSDIKKRWSLLGFLWLIIIVFGLWTTIGVNTVGIMYNPLKGGIQEKILDQGIQKKSPFDKVYKLSTQIQEMNFKGVSVQTSDGQWVDTELQIQLRIMRENAFEYFRKYEGKSLNDIESIILNTTKQKLEEITTQYNVIEMLGSKRNEIITKTLKLVKEEMQKDGICVERLVLVDTDAGEEIEKAIAKEAVAKKEAEAAKYNKEKAEAEGEAKVIQAKKEKEVNELKQKTLTNEVLTEQFINKWDGKLPTTMLSNDILKSFNLNNKEEN